MPKLISIIESYETRGKGIEGDPVRNIRQYYTLDGKFLAEEIDLCKWEKKVR